MNDETNTDLQWYMRKYDEHLQMMAQDRAERGRLRAETLRLLYENGELKRVVEKAIDTMTDLLEEQQARLAKHLEANET